MQASKGKTDKEVIEKRVREIGEALLRFQFLNQNVGYIDGSIGIVPFLFDLSNYFNDNRYLERAEEILLNALKTCNYEGMPLGYSFGVAGVGWVMEHLVEKGLVEPTDYLHSFDDRISKSMLTELSVDHWDPLHGALGISNYLFYRLENPLVKERMINMLDYFEEKAVVDGAGIKWGRYQMEVEMVAFNLGLAHGMPAILNFLCHCILHDLEKERCLVMAKKFLVYLLKQQGTNPEKSVYRYLEGGPEMEPRLAWCYGDLGVTSVLVFANKVIGGVEREVRSLISKLVERRDLKQSMINDAGFCHGASGTLHLFNYFRKEGYGDLISEETMQYWVQQTLGFWDADRPEFGYRMYPLSDDKTIPRREYSVLDGIAGIGGGLLSFLTGDLDWSKGLFINHNVFIDKNK